MPDDTERGGRQSVEVSTRGNSTSGDAQPLSPSNSKIARPGHQRFVFPDPVALRYLEEDPAATVLERRRPLKGYEAYLVEQWACSRTHPTFIIATYTGDLSSSIFVGILSVPTDENAWSTRLKTYFQAISQYHARKKETPFGTLMVTNLSGFPSVLSVISIPEGDIRKHREDFFVNENLKRMGCAGRAGLNLQPPPRSTQAKYWHLYHTSDKVPLYTSVIELVKLCQLALVIFDKLLPAYADGLLCDVTERALTDWWSEIGTDMFNLEPNDGILGPTTVSGLIGLLMGSHNRLKVAGAPVSKDPFEVEATKRAIAYFQKSQKLPRTRRLDRQTIDKLHRTTAKAASGEGWIVPRAVKSTVAELSGKGGEMVMGMVGARDKTLISEVETLDIERLSQLVVGSRARWLWQGKPIKQGTTDFSRPNDGNEIVFATDDQGGFMWTAKKRDDAFPANRFRAGTVDSVEQNPSSPDQRSGFDRLKDRVGISGPRSHQQYRGQSKDFVPPEFERKLEQRGGNDQEYFPLEMQVTTLSSLEEVRPSNDKINANAYQQENESKPSLVPEVTVEQQSPNIIVSQADEEPERSRSQDESSSLKQSIRRDLSPVMNVDRYRDILPVFRTQEATSQYLRHSRSAIKLRPVELDTPRANRIPRHLSFSFLEESILNWEDVTSPAKEELNQAKMDATQQIRLHQYRSRGEQELSRKILSLEQNTLPWTLANVELVDDLEEVAQQQHQGLKGYYNERYDDFLTLQTSSQGLMNEERSALTEAVRKVDILGAKLDYELNVLESRVEDVEDGVADFEKSIEQIERKIDSLVARRPTVGRRSWFPWLKGASNTKS